LADLRDPMILFYGDGAAAAVLEPSTEPGFLAAAFQADGFHSSWGIYPGGTFEPATSESSRPRPGSHALSARHQRPGLA
jgi:3-oxoacyl-[acyl-carrier-protein] synthase-3